MKILKKIYHIFNLMIGVIIIFIMLLPILFKITNLNKLFNWLDVYFPLIE
jgi:hypothetical protein